MTRPGPLTVFTALLVLVCAAAPAKAQPRIHVHAGLSLPGGDYGGTDAPADGGASPGYAITAELEIDLGGGGLVWSTLGGVNKNPFDDAALSYSDSALVAMRDDVGEEEMPGFTIDKGGWWAVPLVTGLRYERPLTGGLAGFVSGHVGLAAVSTPSLKWTYVNQVDRVAEEGFEWGVSFAWAVGAGLDIGDRFTLGGRAWFVGSPGLTATREYYATRGDVGAVIWTDEHDWDVDLQMVTVQLGIRFDS